MKKSERILFALVCLALVLEVHARGGDGARTAQARLKGQPRNRAALGAAAALVGNASA